MPSRKEEGLKQFLISERKRIGTGYTSAPVWAMQKKGERIWNTKQKRHWKRIELGKMYRKRKNKLKGEQ